MKKHDLFSLEDLKNNEKITEFNTNLKYEPMDKKSAIELSKQELEQIKNNLRIFDNFEKK